MNFSYYGAFTWMPSLLADQFGSLTKSFGYTLAIAIAQLPFLAAWLVEIWGRRKTLSVFLAVSAVAAFAFSQAGSVAAVLGFGMLLSASNLWRVGRTVCGDSKSIRPACALLRPVPLRHVAEWLPS